MEGDGDEGEEEADVKSRATDEVLVDVGDYGVDEAAVGDDEDACECGLWVVGIRRR